MPFFAIFIAIPLIEAIIFFIIGDSIGLLTTIMLALLTAIIGGSLVQRQGLNTFSHIKQALDQGKIPLGDLFDGICQIAAGALLITPGFLTDTIGFTLLIPAARTILKDLIKRHTDLTVHDMRENASNGARGKGSQTNPDIIDVEFEDITKK